MRWIACGALLVLIACRDNARYSTTSEDHYAGGVVAGSFVRAGIAENVQMCVSLDAERLQDVPGTISTSDGRFRNAQLRPIPQIWHDPLSTMSFGDGRRQNLVYVASPTATDAGDNQEAMVIVSLMENGGIEVRIVRGAPRTDAGSTAEGQSPPLFGIFTLQRHGGACAF
ncbi:MAG: hypothetical protein KF819_02685 [Labilithrix sp.]|nr:hypothetical protein [Labilithrix sp.]